MAVTGTGNLFRAAPIVSAKPFLIHCKLWRPIGVGQNDPFSLYETSGVDDFRLRVNNSNVILQEIAGGSTAQVLNGAQAPDSQWFSVSIAFVSSTSRFLYVNGTLFLGDTTDLSPATPTDTLFRPPLSGACAELSAWDITGFISDERTDLDQRLHDGGSGGNGANPIDLNAEGAEAWAGRLLTYVRALSLADICDLSGNDQDFSISGTLSVFGSHPPVDSVPNTCPGVGASLLLLLNARGDN